VFVGAVVVVVGGGRVFVGAVVVVGLGYVGVGSDIQITALWVVDGTGSASTTSSSSGSNVDNCPNTLINRGQKGMCGWPVQDTCAQEGISFVRLALMMAIFDRIDVHDLASKLFEFNDICSSFDTQAMPLEWVLNHFLKPTD
jgi:hypothetical protein